MLNVSVNLLFRSAMDVGIAAEFLATLVLRRRHLIMQIWLSYHTEHFNYNFLSNFAFHPATPYHVSSALDISRSNLLF